MRSASRQRSFHGGIRLTRHELPEPGILRSASRIDRVGLVLVNYACDTLHVNGDVDAHPVASGGVPKTSLARAVATCSPLPGRAGFRQTGAGRGAFGP